jgi:hypothetical protein
MPRLLHCPDHSSSGPATLLVLIPTRQVRLDHGPDDLRGKERKRDGVDHVPLGAALPSRNLIHARSAENLIEPLPCKCDQAQQDGSGPEGVAHAISIGLSGSGLG